MEETIERKNQTMYNDLEDIERKHLQLNPYLVNQMGGDVIAEGGYGCVYFPSVLCSGKEDTGKNKDKYLSKLQPFDYTAKKEIDIGNTIKKIPNFERYFSPIISTCPIQVGEMEDGLVKQCSLFKKSRWSKNKEIMIMRMNYIQGDILSNTLKCYTDDDETVTNTKIYSTPNEISITTNKTQHPNDTKSPIEKNLMLVMDTYSHLLDGLEILYDNNIIHFDFKGNNIMYDENQRLPIIIDFGLSIDLTKLKTEEDYEHAFYIYAPDYYLWCPEIMMLSYLYSYKRNPTLDELEMIATECAFNNPLHYFNETYDENSREMYATEMYTYFIDTVYNKTLEEATENLMKYSHTWDNYSLSILYGGILSYMIQEKSLEELMDDEEKNAFVIHFFELLLNNVSADPRKRLTIQETKQEFLNIRSGNSSGQSVQSITNSIQSLKEQYSQSLENNVFQTMMDQQTQSLQNTKDKIMNAKMKDPSTKTLQNIMELT